MPAVLLRARLLLIVLLSILLITACAGSQSASPADTTPVAAAPQLLAALPDADAITRALAAVPPEQTRTGAQYSNTLPNNRAEADAALAQFTPDWPGTGIALTDAAYACYLFSLPGYSGNATARLSWLAAPPETASVFLGCADWQGEVWRWQELSRTFAMNAVLPPLSQSLRADGAMLLAVVALAPDGTALELASVTIGPESELPAADVTFIVDTGADGTPISPYIYGTNGLPADSQAIPRISRGGGNRWTAYNWENNASNAGSDWYHQNDSLMGETGEPGWTARTRIEAAQAIGAAALITVPMADYVAADKLGGGDVNQTPNYLEVRFKQNKPRKGSAFVYPPDTTDDYVYEDEYVYWLNDHFDGAATGANPSIFFDLDNEPALWSYTHARIHPDDITYAELMARTVDLSTAMKDAVPGCVIFGPVLYGWNAFVNLQSASDSGEHGDFIHYYLDVMKAEELSGGRRLLDVLDVHWYPEAKGGGVRITGDDTSAEVVAARLQAPRSLWDETYTEDSWITQWSTMGPIYLIPRLKAQIATHYPGTKLAFSEYNYGGGGHISGGLATADVLGIYGREGLFEASIWPSHGDNTYTYGALALYTNYDNAGSSFGETSLPVTNPNAEDYSAYAARRTDGKLTLVLINKTSETRTARVQLANSATGYFLAQTYVIEDGTPEPVQFLNSPLAGSELNCTMYPYSATLLEVE